MKIKCFGCGESGVYYPYVPSKLYCFSCYNKIVQERDRLKAENEKLRSALEDIYQLPNDSNIQHAIELVNIMQDKAQQALNEVTNIKSDYREHLRNMPESEYRRLHENKWDNSESEIKK